MDPATRLELILESIQLFLSLVCSVIMGVICRRLCSNLYQYRLNWIIEPSSTNKVYAMLTVSSFLVRSISDVVLRILLIIELSTNFSILVFTSMTQYNIYLGIESGVSLFGIIFYCLYLTSTLEYQMKAEPLFKAVISTKLICIVKFMTISLMPIYILVQYYYQHTNDPYYKNIPFVSIYELLQLE